MRAALSACGLSPALIVLVACVSAIWTLSLWPAVARPGVVCCGQSADAAGSWEEQLQDSSRQGRGSAGEPDRAASPPSPALRQLVLHTWGQYSGGRCGGAAAGQVPAANAHSSKDGTLRAQLARFSGSIPGVRLSGPSSFCQHGSPAVQLCMLWLFARTSKWHN